ncbi:MAG TPA: hypothetical protein VF310_06815 [Vicinamibacteria bacterium]
MGARSEAGEGRFGAIVGLLLIGAVAFAAWNVVPVYYANYEFADKMIEIARTPKYRGGDEKIMDLLMKEAAEQRITGYLTRQGCRVETQDAYRRIRCEYAREVEILPGWKHVFQFKNATDQPLI